MVERNTGDKKDSDKKDDDKKKCEQPKIPVSKSSPTLTASESQQLKTSHLVFQKLWTLRKQ